MFNNVFYYNHQTRQAFRSAATRLGSALLIITGIIIAADGLLRVIAVSIWSAHAALATYQLVANTRKTRLWNEQQQSMQRTAA